jgi:hypothetical protein
LFNEGPADLVFGFRRSAVESRKSGGIPPKTGFGYGFVGCERFLKTTWIGDDVNEFRQDLRNKPKGNLRLKNHALEERVSSLFKLPAEKDFAE